MTKKKLNCRINFFFLVAIFFSIHAQDSIDYRYEGPPYYPEQLLSEFDTLIYPIEFKVGLDLKNLKNLEVLEDDYLGSLIVTSFSNYPSQYLSKLGDTISLKHSDFFSLYLRENKNETYKGDVFYYDKKTHPYLFKSGDYSKEVQLIEGEFDINWDLSDYPFDTQFLSFQFNSKVDSSIIELQPIKKNFTEPFFFKSLKKGYEFKGVSFNKLYESDENDIILTSPNNYRPLVKETLEVSYELKREGKSLFFKLFIGGFLSYLISCFIFLIPFKEFESRVTLAVGAIFGAIGNRYFVDSVMPTVQVFTKADAISNLIIFMVVFNILLMILQRSDKTFLNKLQDSKKSLICSLYIFTTLTLIIILW